MNILQSRVLTGGSDEEDYTKLALKMSVWNGNESGCVRHSDRDSDSDSDVRCHAYVMDGGLCLRTNTLVTYCEANRQVCHSSLHCHSTHFVMDTFKSRLKT